MSESMPSFDPTQEQKPGRRAPKAEDVNRAFRERVTPSAAAAATLVEQGRQEAEARADQEASLESKRALIADLKRGAERTIVAMREHMKARTDVFENNLKEVELALKLIERTAGSQLGKEVAEFLISTKGEVDLLKGERRLHRPREEKAQQQAAA